MIRLVMLILLAGCTADRGPVLTPAADDSPAARHALTSGELRATMAALDRVRPDRMPQELVGATTESAHLTAVGDAARRMAVAADAIPLALEGVRLSAADRQVFLDLAARLREEALSIERAAAEGDAASVRRRVATVESTCNECHDAFRVLPVMSR